MLFLIAIGVGLLIGVIIAINFNAKMAATAINAANDIEEEIIMKSRGKFQGGNHPLIGVDVGIVELVLTESYLILIGNEVVTAPLGDIKAEVTTASKASAKGIFAFGLMGLAAKERVYIIEINDDTTGEQYKCALTGNLGELIDKMNAQKYKALAIERELMQEEMTISK